MESTGSTGSSSQSESESVIKLLYDKYPDAIQKVNKDGKYPLHLAVEKNKSEFVINFLIEKYPEAIRKVDKNGNYPLHLAALKCCNGTVSSVSVLKLLIGKYPDAIH